jgi:uncharacterized membrane protein YecN with MAPEG domain
MATEAEKKKIEEKWAKEMQKNFPVFYLQAGFAVAFVVCVLGGGYYFFPAFLPLPSSNDFTAKLVYTLRCFVFPQIIVLMFAIMRVMRKRGNTPAGNPLLGLDKNYLLAEKNALTNTVEQLLCILLVVLVLITYLEPSEMKIIPLLSFSFAVGRLFFLIGYSIGSLYRVAGIGISFFSISSMFIYIIYLMYSRGFMYDIPSTPSTGGASAKTEL